MCSGIFKNVVQGKKKLSSHAKYIYTNNHGLTSGQALIMNIGLAHLFIFITNFTSKLPKS
jgi:hypothetical protein